jgi:Zn-dependent peptidase ImmA (M78 family)
MMRAASVRHYPVLVKKLRSSETEVFRILLQTRKNDSPPITWEDLEFLAFARGFAFVREKDLSVSGFTIPLADKQAILINGGEPLVRQRFTLAHEIAHSFVDKDTDQEVWRQTPLGHQRKAEDSIEDFCDRLAGRILMPSAFVQKELEDSESNLGLPSHLSKKYEVSLLAATIRVQELKKKSARMKPT